MKLLIFCSMLAAAAEAVPQGYILPQPFGPLFRGSSSPGFHDAGFDRGSLTIGCGPDQVRHVDGSCVTPQVTRNLYVYTAPPAPPVVGPRPNIPPPRVEHNVLFIRTPERDQSQEPIVVPPPQTRNVVYVLNKRPGEDQQVIHVPAPEQQTPEVFFVNYGEGENPTLPTGEDLQSAINSASNGGGIIIDTLGSGPVDTVGGGPVGTVGGFYNTPYNS